MALYIVGTQEIFVELINEIERMKNRELGTS